MKGHYKPNPRLTIEVEGETAKDLFAQISSVQEVFEAESTCGLCQGTDIRFSHRKVEDFDYYELQCTKPECRARFQFGQAKKGGALFPKRKDEDGNWLPNRGWSKFMPKGDSGPIQATTGSRAQDGTPIKPTGPTQPREAGVATFANWHDAEDSPHWGEMYLKVDGKLFKVVDGNYKEVREAARRAT